MQTNLTFHTFGESFFTLLNNFIFANYLILRFRITLSRLFGIIAYVKPFKTKIYFPIILALISFVIVKSTQVSYYPKFEDKFLITMIIFLGVLFVLYMLFLVMESNPRNIRFEISILLLLAFFGILLILFLGLEIQTFADYAWVNVADKKILGVMASRLFILGVSVLYGVTVKTNFTEISEFGSQQNSMIMLGLLLLLFGLLFYVIFNFNNMFEANTLIVFSLILSAILGSIQAVEQTKIKRFIAYTIIFNNAFFLSMVLITGHNAFYSLVESLMLYIIITVTTILTMKKYVNEMEKMLKNTVKP